MFKLEHLCHTVAEAMVIIGVLIVVVGVIKAAVLYVRLEFTSGGFQEKSLNRDELRSHLGQLYHHRRPQFNRRIRSRLGQSYGRWTWRINRPHGGNRRVVRQCILSRIQ